MKAKYCLFKNYIASLYKKRDAELKTKKDEALFMRHPDDEALMKDEEIPYFIYIDIVRRYFTKVLNISGIWTRAFLDDDENEIFVVFKATESTLAQESCSGGFFKEVELGHIDLLSLMPVDEQQRPSVNKSLMFVELSKEERLLENEDDVQISMDKQSNTLEAFVGFARRLN